MILITNKRAKFDYELVKDYEAGISLLGFEVKALKSGRGSLTGSYIIIRGGEAFLVGFDLPPYQLKNTPEDYDSKRPRKLLLSKKEISELGGYEKEKNLAIVPINIFLKDNKIKLKIAVGKGKKKFDKRETIKKRETDRDIERVMKGRR